MLEYLGSFASDMELGHPTRVGIDGVDASGKTSMANELAEKLRPSGRQIIRVSVDDFHNPRAIRYQKGQNSPEGYYFDSFNYEAIVSKVLKPLGPDGDLSYEKAVFDFKTDARISSPREVAKRDAILLMDGIFLFRPELVNFWDLKVFLDVDFETTFRRAIKRDGYYLGSEQETISKYTERYVPGQKLYLQEARPKDRADIVIDNTDLANPAITKTSREARRPLSGAVRPRW